MVGRSNIPDALADWQQEPNAEIEKLRHALELTAAALQAAVRVGRISANATIKVAGPPPRSFSITNILDRADHALERNGEPAEGER